MSVAATEYYLALDGIKGESKAVGHVDEIDLEAFGWGEFAQGGGGPGGGGGAGKVTMQDVHVVARLNRASPALMLACAQGKHLKTAVLTARRTGPAKQDFLVLRFEDVVITSYNVSGTEADGGPPTDQVSFAFARIRLEYRPQKQDGSLGPVVKSGWDVKQNKAI
jgi:type VI secretion system secreted protein Hcp